MYVCIVYYLAQSCRYTHQENNTLENHMRIKLNVEQVVAQLCELFRCELVKNTPHLSKDEIISAFWGECIASNS